MYFDFGNCAFKVEWMTSLIHPDIDWVSDSCAYIYAYMHTYIVVHLNVYNGIFLTILASNHTRFNNTYKQLYLLKSGTAEIESALVACKEVSESAVVGFPHEIKGEGICCFVILRYSFPLHLLSCATYIHIV